MTLPKNPNGRIWIMRVGTGLAVIGIATAVFAVVRHLNAAGHAVLVERVAANSVQQNKSEAQMGLIVTKLNTITTQQAVNTKILERIEERIP